MMNFLFEIGTEELPAAYAEQARKQFGNKLAALFSEKRISFKKVVSLASFRRFSLLAEGLSARQEDKKTSVKGPSKKAAFDEKGKPTPAALGFAKGQGVEVGSLVISRVGKEERVFAEKTVKGLETKKILPAIVDELIRKASFPKMMKWPQADFQFARPIRWLTVIFNNKTVKVSIGGLNSVSTTCGHKFLVSKPIKVKDVDKYEKLLKNNHVIVNQEERRETIYRAVNQVIKRTGGRLLEDNDLLDEVNYLLEYPTPILGQFDRKYLELPQDVLVTCMRHHQKYFSVVDEKGKLLPYFVGVRDGVSRNMNDVKDGYERVLTARLEDAEFFYKQDTRKKLEDYVGELKNVLFQEKTGTAFDKVTRIRELAGFIMKRIASRECDGKAVLRAAYLCKADLMTQLVKEFPELQGVMGREYALVSGENEIIAKSICEHYLPLTADGKLPESLEGAVVSIADKVDTIAGDFFAGRIPTGSGDPYGLRRQAHGIVRIILDKSLDLSLVELFRESLKQLNCREIDDVTERIMKFLRQRVESVFEEKGIRYDEIKAVLDTGFSVLVDAGVRADAVHNLRGLPDFEPITAAFKRAKNILKQAGGKGVKLNALVFSAGTMKEPKEKALYEKFSEVRAEIEKMITRHEYEKALGQLVNLRVPLDEFFEKVMVMDKDKQARENRLALLSDIVGLFMKIADFSSIVVDDSESNQDKSKQ